jgi:hypothetical protein
MITSQAETSRIERPPRGREEVPAQISRLLRAHELQTWFLAEHFVDAPLPRAD